MVKVTEILFLQSESVIILLGSMEVSMHLALYNFFLSRHKSNNYRYDTSTNHKKLLR